MRALLVAALAASGCGDINVESSCGSGELRCEGQLLQLCGSAGNWTTHEDCAASGMVCQASTKTCEGGGTGDVVEGGDSDAVGPKPDGDCEDVCTDGEARCTDEGELETCELAGECWSFGAPQPCEQDDNPCTAALCEEELEACGEAKPTAGECDDGDLCTDSDKCVDGTCTPGDPVDCDDGLSCTNGACDAGTGDCVTSVMAGSCLIGGFCHAAGEPNPGLACSVCNPAQAADQWSAAGTETPCDDGDACTVGDKCDVGSCTPGAPMDCDDNKDCTLGECSDGACAYAISAGHCLVDDVCYAHGEAPDANPCVACTDESQTALVAITADCDDGDLCTLGDACAGGACVSGDPLDCNDGLDCTLDACEGDGECSSALQDEWCVIDEACVEAGTPNPDNLCQRCDPPVDSSAWSDADGAACASGDLCQTGGTCSAGACLETPKVCDDLDACNGVETCDAAQGCVPGTAPVCNDGDACNGVETCDPAQGCVAGSAPVCDDGDACNGVETCDATTGCQGGTAPVCDDGNACDGVETCDPASGCVEGTALSCDDGNACNGVEGCSAIAGCEDGTPLTCDDGDVCNGVETCDPASGCVDGDALTCNDGDACNGVETCDKSSGCVDGTAPTCDDTDPCNGVETCDASSGCVDGTPVDCSDLDGPCTTGVCAKGACQAAILSGPCDNSDACTDGVCVSDVCLASSGQDYLNSGLPVCGSFDEAATLSESHFFEAKLTAAVDGDAAVAVSDVTGFSVGDEVLLWEHRGGSAGRHSLHAVAAVDGDVLTLAPPIDQPFSAGAWAARVATFGDLLVDSVVTPLDSGLIALKVSGTLTVTEDGHLNANGAGFAGGPGTKTESGMCLYAGPDPGCEYTSSTGCSSAACPGLPGESVVDGTPVCTGGQPAAAVAAGGGSNMATGSCAGGGGGGGLRTTGTKGMSKIGSHAAGGGAVLESAPDRVYLLPGSGGGSGSVSGNGGQSGDGGAGGGVVWIRAHTIDLQGAVSADGEDGQDGSGLSNAAWGGAGGGSGGTVYLHAHTIGGAGKVSVLGGTTGGENACGGCEGGTGGLGFVYVDGKLDGLASGPTLPEMIQVPGLPQGATCGDGVVDTGEECDDGTVFTPDLCSGTCEIVPVSVATQAFDGVPEIVRDGDGRLYLIGTRDEPQDPSGVYVRRFSALGAPLDPGFTLVNSHTSGVQSGPSGAVNADGDVAFVYGDGSSVRGRRVAPGPAFEFLDTPQATIAEVDQGTVAETRVVRMDNNRLAVVWIEDDGAGSGMRRYAIYKSDWSVVKAPANANIKPAHPAGLAVAALPGVGFVAVWPAQKNDFGGGDRINARRFGFDGAPLEDLEWQVNSVAHNAFRSPAVVSLPDGFVIAWTWVEGQQDVSIKRFNMGGGATTGEIAVINNPDMAHGGARLAATGDGTVLVVFGQNGPGHNGKAYGHRFNATLGSLGGHFELTGPDGTGSPNAAVLESGDFVASYKNNSSYWMRLVTAKP